MNNYQSPPVHLDTAADIARLFEDSLPHIWAYARTLKHLKLSGWRERFERMPEAALADYIDSRMSYSQAITALPILYGHDPDGNEIAIRFISPYRKGLPRGHLPYVFFDRRMIPMLRAAGFLDRPWHVGRQSKDGSHTVSATNVGGKKTASIRTAVAALHLRRPVSRVCLMPGGHPGDLRLSNLTLVQAVERGQIVKPNPTPLSALAPHREADLARLARYASKLASPASNKE